MDYIIKIISVVSLLFLFNSCDPLGEEMCTGGSGTSVLNLAKITPLQTTYNQGDIINIKLVVPNIINFGTFPINLFLQTNDSSVSVTYGRDLFYSNNVTTMVTGYNTLFLDLFEMPYIPERETYELELNIKLNRVGTYSFFSGNVLRFQGIDKCNLYTISTNFEGTNSEGKIEFVVQ
jgi:hypothetical protein